MLIAFFVFRLLRPSVLLQKESPRVVYARENAPSERKRKWAVVTRSKRACQNGSFYSTTSRIGLGWSDMDLLLIWTQRVARSSTAIAQHTTLPSDGVLLVADEQ